MIVVGVQDLEPLRFFKVMNNNVIKLDPDNIDNGKIRMAADIIKKGGLVAFPTETVYGLGADALNPEAAIKIFEVKKRPLDDPLIVHISDKGMLDLVAEDVPDIINRLIDVFWPGPLTVIAKKKEIVPDIVTTGLQTVAVRMPSGMIAQELIKAAGRPIAAPSANIFGRPSPADAAHVVAGIGEYVDIILDGGRTEIGLESTVIEMDGEICNILRPGGVSVEDIRDVICDVNIMSEKDVIENSPGKYSRHYSPRGKVIIIDNNSHQKTVVFEQASLYRREGLKVGIMAKKEHAAFYDGFDVKILGPEKDLKKCASEFFHVLHDLDNDGVDVIIAEAVEETGLGLAIMNRLRKAAGSI